jgi:hypothetical protein
MTVPLIDSDQQIRSLLDTGVSMLEVSRQLGAAPKRAGALGAVRTWTEQVEA